MALRDTVNVQQETTDGGQEGFYGVHLRQENPPSS